MSDQDFKPGDLAIIDCEENAGIHRLIKSVAGLAWFADNSHEPGDACWHRPDSARGQSAQWAAVLNPADDEQMERLAKAYFAAYHANGTGMAEAVRSLRTPPTPPLPPEPPVGSWVLDARGCMWRRDKGGWNDIESWPDLLGEYGPVRLVTLGDPIGGDGDE
jgi:hypothetical protein